MIKPRSILRIGNVFVLASVYSQVIACHVLTDMHYLSSELFPAEIIAAHQKD